MSYHAPEYVTLKARHGRDARLGLRVRPLGGLGQADDAPLPSGMTIEPRPGEPGYAAPATSTGGKTGASVTPTSGKAGGTATGPLLPYAPPIAQSDTSWLPWAIGGGIALLVLGGGAIAMSR